MTRSTLVGYPGSYRDVHGCAGGPTVTLPTTRQSHASLVQSAARAPRARPCERTLDADGSRRIVERSAIARRAIRVLGRQPWPTRQGQRPARGSARAGPTGSAGRRRGRLRQRGTGGDRLRRRHRGGRSRSRRVPHHQQATEKLRTDQRSTRANKLDEDPESVAERFRSGELDTLDLVRHYGVVLDWGTGELLPRTTEQYRDTLRRRSAACWS